MNKHIAFIPLPDDTFSSWYKYNFVLQINSYRHIYGTKYPNWL